MFDLASASGTVEGRELPRENATTVSEVVPESFVTSGGFSTLEGIARCRADERVVDARIDERKGIMPIPPVDELFRQEDIPKEKTR